MDNTAKKVYDINADSNENVEEVEERGSKKDLATLYSKVARVMGQVGKIEKSGYNKYDDYEYATAEDIKEALRPLCAKENLWISSEVKGYSKKAVQTQRGNSTEIELGMYFTMRCGDTGAKVKLLYSGYALDEGDKHIYKAYTGAIKYFLINNFMLSTGDDPEMDSPKIKQEAPEPKKKTEKKTDKKAEKAIPVKKKSEHKDNNIEEIRQLWKKNQTITQDIVFDELEDMGKERDIALISEIKDDDKLSEIIGKVKEKIEKENKED